MIETIFAVIREVGEVIVVVCTVVQTVVAVWDYRREHKKDRQDPARTDGQNDLK